MRNYPPQQQQQQPQQPYQQQQQPYQQGYPGTMGRRKREVKDYHFGIHRLMSTGITKKTKIIFLDAVKMSDKLSFHQKLFFVRNSYL